jgi:hypothetical protein
LSSVNLILKYADDTNLLVTEKTDISVFQEFENKRHWAVDEKMIINLSKTEETVFVGQTLISSYNPIQSLTLHYNF